MTSSKIDTCKWFKVTKSDPCNICHKPDWCTRADNGASCCMRIESMVAMKNGGWLHYQGDTIPLTPTPKPEPVDEINAAHLMQSWLIKSKMEWLEKEALNLGVAVEALVALQCAWANEHNAWAYPMRNGDNDIIGIRLRNSTGKKWAVKGSHQGLFIPQIPPSKTVYITEGPTDTAAALSIGLFAIGRPSCCCGLSQLTTALNWLGIHRATIISDNDTPGIEGAQKLMDGLKLSTCLFIPPAKDLRQFVSFGGTRQIFDSMIKDLVWHQP